MKRCALIIGIDDYKEDKLLGCVHDAKELKCLLEQDEYNFDNIVTFNNSDATKENIIHSLESCAGVDDLNGC